MTRWDLVSQALRLELVSQSQLIAQASILRRRAGQHRNRVPQVEPGEARCPRPVTPAAQVSVPGTEWQRGILSLGASWLATQTQTTPVVA